MQDADDEMAVHDLRPLAIGVSLKLYLGIHETLEWTDRVLELAMDHVAIRSGVAELWILPSFLAIPLVLSRTEGTLVMVGAQNLHWKDRGAFTGEVSGIDLASLGCRYVEVGHAERRRLFCETEAIVAAKTAAALRNGLVPILCLGEAEKMSAPQAAEECIRQFHSALADSQGGDVVVAYEPHWAIGASEPAPSEYSAVVCTALRQAIAAETTITGRVIYGGSAGPGLLTQLGGAVDGLFLGRFAHDPDALVSVLDDALELSFGRLS